MASDEPQPKRLKVQDASEGSSSEESSAESLERPIYRMRKEDLLTALEAEGITQGVDSLLVPELREKLTEVRMGSKAPMTGSFEKVTMDMVVQAGDSKQGPAGLAAAAPAATVGVV